mmetsp:Transcript_62555/g.74074  ORF Transcript_62555/g.74074 Transcript_62555/m.74074 type:complete len:329 (-) Transcript_62555:351-1337(-)|eukprot:CAMPEP_0172500060 /NCGR_PEP_ID=MMETSP1066-20121228/134075_1 /TAXON_ID=671091 /ORGANISM="Coscinodiscus wailesii, Strain CCMP2513" /LENGTH=328 /DNA_ID=CAMNT_0013274123 /DNA_START=16 /DNA_END=1002 /DNA_ORIENTATION=-
MSGNKKKSLFRRLSSKWRKKRTASPLPGSNIDQEITQDTISHVKDDESSETEDDSYGSSQGSPDSTPQKPYVTKDGDHVITSRDGGFYRPSMVRDALDNTTDSIDQPEDTTNVRFDESLNTSIESVSLISKTRSQEQYTLGSNTWNHPTSYHQSIDSRSRSCVSQSTETYRSPKKKGTRRSTVVLKEAPSAKEAAFSGPPRYDWIDIETAAALKVQSIYRRHRVIQKLEKRGMLTSAMRNRLRKKKAVRKMKIMSDDTPFLFTCCDMGFLFGDSSHYNDPQTYGKENKATFEEKKKQQAEHEENLRKFKMRKKDSQQMLESIEVVEDV